MQTQQTFLSKYKSLIILKVLLVLAIIVNDVHRILSLSSPYLLRVYTLGLGTELVRT